MSSFGPSDQQIASEEQSRRTSFDSRSSVEKLKDLTKEQLLNILEAEIMRNDKLQSEVRELREEKVKLSLILEEEDERRANMFLKKVEELEATVKACPKCSIAAPAAIIMKNPSSQIVVPRSMSMSSLKEHPEDER